MDTPCCALMRDAKTLVICTHSYWQKGIHKDGLNFQCFQAQPQAVKKALPSRSPSREWTPTSVLIHLVLYQPTNPLGETGWENSYFLQFKTFPLLLK